MGAVLKPKPPGLYVHVPFCARACPYCDFDFEVGRSPQLEAYVEGLAREIDERDAREGIRDLDFDTLYLGGGTPSLLGPRGLAQVLDLLEREFPRASYQELTVEINPEHWGPALLDGLRERKVTRISLGVQSFDPAGLRALGRVHDAAQAKAALCEAVAAGFSVSCDLIVGWPGQGEASLERDIDTFAACGAQHISVYALTIEPDTPWTKLVRRGLRVLPDPDRQAQRLLRSEAMLLDREYQHYEIASYARPGAQARHNHKYWSCCDYIGLGPSAHSARYDAQGGVRRRGNRRGLLAWCADPAAAQSMDELGAEDSAAEALWLGLRRFEGVAWEAFSRRFARVDTDALLRRAKALFDRGILQRVPEPASGPAALEQGGEAGSALRIRVAPDQWLLHDEIAHTLL